MPNVKVEIGLDLGQKDPDAFTLNDSIKGVLDNTSYTLGGPKFVDITNRLLSATTRRGKSQGLDRIDAGIASLEVSNNDRLFDPVYAAGTYFGQLIPRREIRISGNDYPVLYGFIDDFDITYDPSGQSRVRIDLSDALSVLANSELAEDTPPSELSGARINRILDLPEVDWAADKREIDTGNTLMLDTTIAENTGTLEYLQLVASSESGTLFLSKDGKIVFTARNSVPNVVNLSFSDEETVPGFTTIPFSDLRIVYGSENLYNRIVLENSDVIPETAIAEDLDSQALYGVRVLSLTGLLVQEPADLQFLADFLLARFKEPQYRFEAVTVVLDTLSEAKQDNLFDLEIGDIVQVRFTPSGIPPAIEQYSRIIGISHDWNSVEKRITLQLERLDFAIFILDSPVLGTLDNDRLSY